jgi:hypothetical protein
MISDKWCEMIDLIMRHASIFCNRVINEIETSIFTFFTILPQNAKPSLVKTIDVTDRHTFTSISLS